MTQLKLFYGSRFYPDGDGGYDDFKGVFLTIATAQFFVEEHLKDSCDMWAQIILDDCIVWRGKKDDSEDSWIWRKNEKLAHDNN